MVHKITNSELKGEVSSLIESIRFDWELTENQNGNIEAEKETFNELKRFLKDKGCM